MQVGSRIAKGAALFKLDDRDRQAELHVREAALASARATLARLQSLPREEDLPPARARVAAAESELADAQNQLALAESLTDKRAMATQEWDRRRFAVRAAEARLAESQSQLALLQAGAWKPEIEIARVEVDSAQAKVQAIQTDIDRLTVRAPIDGTVLQLNLRLGEFAQSGVLAQPLIVLGDLERMHVRVDIDENDAWRFVPGAAAQAFVRGNRELATKLAFVRVEPYVIPKRSLTGESTERVDTRVLQVLYSFDPKSLPVYVGQQMDVFIEASHAVERTGAVQPSSNDGGVAREASKAGESAR